MEEVTAEMIAEWHLERERISNENPIVEIIARWTVRGTYKTDAVFARGIKIESAMLRNPSLFADICLRRIELGLTVTDVREIEALGSRARVEGSYPLLLAVEPHLNRVDEELRARLVRYIARMYKDKRYFKS